ncbi:MAG: hypothetical protein ACXV74_11255 [Methylobacter sp.]
MRKFTRLFDVIITVWILGCAAVLLVYCLWSLDRGLDLTDESYYLTAAINPDAIILWATAMHWFTSGLWQLSGSLAGFRGMGLAILAVSSVVLAFGTVRAFAMSGIGVVARGFPILLIIACSLAGALLYHAFVPFTPSYNLLAVSGTYMALGLVCFTVNIPHGLRFYCFQLLSGLALGIAFLAKFSSGVIAWGIVCSVVVAVLSDSFRQRVLGIGLITGGMAATVGIAVILHTTFSEALAQFRLGALVYMLGANETFPDRLARYFTETSSFLRLIFIDFAIPLVLFGIYVARPRFWIALIGLAAFIYVVVTEGYLLGGMDRYGQQAAPLVVAVILSMLATARLWMQNIKAIYLIGVLALLPFCIAIGTYNPLHTQILFSLAPWGVLVSLLAFGIPPVLPGPRHAAMLVCSLFVTIITSQVLTNGFRTPYRLHRPLPEQTEAVTIPPLGTFRVDRETRDSYIKLTQLADSCKIQQGQKFLGLYNIPGIALILQAVPLGFPLLQDRPSTEPILDQLRPEALKSAVVGIDLNSGSYDPGMPKQLATFPAGYRLCGAVTLPYQKQKVELWISQDGR